MKTPANTADSEWPAALRQAASGDGGPLLFLERRADAVVDLDDRGDRPRVSHSRLNGLSATAADGRLVYVADPVPGHAESLARAARDAGPIAPWSAGPRPEAELAPSFLPTDAASRFLAQIMEAAKKLRQDVTLRARWVGFDQGVWIARPGREIVEDRRQGFRVRLEAGLEDRGWAASAVTEAVLPSGPGSELAAALASRVVARLEARSSTQTVPSGERPVVFAPGTGGVLVHEVVGHALEADTVLSGGSWMSRGGDASVAPSSLLVLDDPRRGRAGWRFDDEGLAARPTPLLREGRVAGWLHDGETARRSGRPPTGHGRRSSYREPVRPRMGCTFVAAGRFHPEDVLDGIADGIYVRRMEAATTDTRTGRATFRVTDADRIVDGKIGAPLRAHLLVVDAREALSSVDRVAGDLAFDRCIGSCIHHGQPLSVSVGGPTFRIGTTPVTSW